MKGALGGPPWKCGKGVRKKNPLVKKKILDSGWKAITIPPEEKNGGVIESHPAAIEEAQDLLKSIDADE
jgi:hypothetical protein